MKALLRILLGTLFVLALFWGMWLVFYFQKSAVERSSYWVAIQSRYVQGSGAEQFFTNWAIQADSGNAEAWMQQSIAHNKRGDYARGFALLNEAVALRPIEYLGYRGWVKLFMLRDYRGALSDFHRLDQMTPTLADAPWGEDIYYLMGLCHWQTEQLDSADFWFQYSIEQTTAGPGEEWIDDIVFWYAAQTAYRIGDHARAKDYLHTALRHSPRFAEAYYHQSLWEYEPGNKVLACSLLHQGRALFADGYQLRNPYFAFPDQLYLSDFDAQLLEWDCPPAKVKE